MQHPTLAAWHEIARTRDARALPGLIADDAVFHSPVVHTPQRGKAMTVQYLAAALHVFPANLTYVREVVMGNEAVLEFEGEIDGIYLNGVDMIRWNDEGKIVDFKVMLRPLKAIELIQKQMAAMLAARG